MATANAAREHWSGRTGFILAAVGSAVGLGNMWRFSYLTAEKGGAAFVGLYLVFTAAVGLPVLLAELAIGRGSQKSPVGALVHYGGRPWGAMGVLFVATGALILAYYGVIAGWSLRYVGAALLGSWGDDPAAYFVEHSAGYEAFAFQVGFMVATIAIVAGGVNAGIERVAKIMMPLLFVLVASIALYAFALDGSGPGYAYYLNVNVARVLEIPVVVSAAGQAFFSLSLGMGAMLTFASYLTREHDLPTEGVIIAVSDFGVAFLAGLMVFPLLFALGLEAGVVGTHGQEGELGTVGALFIALPGAFQSMGAAGAVVGTAFFVTLVVGALTSAISLLEVVTAAAIDGLGWSRVRSAWAFGGAITLVGAWPAFGIERLVFMDELANNVLLIGGALGLSIFAGWVMRDPEAELAVGRSGLGPFGAWRMLLRFAVPPVLLFVLYHSVPNVWSALLDL